MATTFPRAIDANVTAFCAKVQPATLPVLVPVQADANAKYLDCFENVKKQIEQQGGKRVYGWSIWECRNSKEVVFLEAEFHAVWENNQNQLIDVSPRPGGETQSMFLPDPHHLYKGERIPSHRYPVKAGEDVRRFIKLTEVNEQWTIAGSAPTDRYMQVMSEMQQVMERLGIGMSSMSEKEWAEFKAMGPIDGIEGTFPDRPPGWKPPKKEKAKLPKKLENRRGKKPRR